MSQETLTRTIHAVRATKATHRKEGSFNDEPFIHLDTRHLRNIVGHFCRIDEKAKPTMVLAQDRGLVLVPNHRSNLLPNRMLEGLIRRLSRKILPAMGALAERGELHPAGIERVERLIADLPVAVDLRPQALIRHLQHP